MARNCVTKGICNSLKIINEYEKQKKLALLQHGRTEEEEQANCVEDSSQFLFYANNFNCSICTQKMPKWNALNGQCKDEKTAKTAILVHNF